MRIFVGTLLLLGTSWSTARAQENAPQPQGRDTVQAAGLLLEGWPKDHRGPKYRAALRACASSNLRWSSAALRVSLSSPPASPR